MERQVLFYGEPDNDSAIVRDGFAGIHIPVLSEKSGRIETKFPDGTKDWIEKNKTGYINSLRRNEIIKYASTCMGIPYLWGGKTVKGFDCSGYIQFTHKVFGINIRRYT